MLAVLDAGSSIRAAQILPSLSLLHRDLQAVRVSCWFVEMSLSRKADPPWLVRLYAHTGNTTTKGLGAYGHGLSYN